MPDCGGAGVRGCGAAGLPGLQAIDAAVEPLGCRPRVSRPATLPSTPGRGPCRWSAGPRTPGRRCCLGLPGAGPPGLSPRDAAFGLRSGTLPPGLAPPAGDAASGCRAPAAPGSPVQRRCLRPPVGDPAAGPRTPGRRRCLGLPGPGPPGLSPSDAALGLRPGTLPLGRRASRPRPAMLPRVAGSRPPPGLSPSDAALGLRPGTLPPGRRVSDPGPGAQWPGS